MQTKQRITILGSTGSIGKSTLDVLARHPGQFGVYALTASTLVDLMLAQCAQFRPEVAVMVREDAARLLADKLKAEGLNTEVRWGAAALDAAPLGPGRADGGCRQAARRFAPDRGPAG